MPFSKKASILFHRFFSTNPLRNKMIGHNKNNHILRLSSLIQKFEKIFPASWYSSIFLLRNYLFNIFGSVSNSITFVILSSLLLLTRTLCEFSSHSVTILFYFLWPVTLHVPFLKQCVFCSSFIPGNIALK